MSLSPNYNADEAYTASPVYEGHWSPILSTYRRQTRSSHHEASDLAKSHCAKLCVTANPRFSVCYRSKIKTTFVLVQRHGVSFLTMSSDGIDINILAVYMNGMLTATCCSQTTRLFLREGSPVKISMPGARNVQLRFFKERIHHLPFVASIRKTALQCLEPGFSLWYSTVGPRKHAAFLQDVYDGRYYCISPGCRKSFSSFREWKCHYGISLRLPTGYARVEISDGQVIPRAGRPLEGCSSDRDIKKDILYHGWAFRSLDDKVYKHKMLEILQRLINKKCAN